MGWFRWSRPVLGYGSLYVRDIGAVRWVSSDSYSDWALRVAGDIHEIMASMSAVSDKANYKDDFLRDNPARLQFLHHDDAVRQSQQIPLAVALCHALQERNASSNVVAGPFACDARHLVNQGGIPTVIFGPGSVSQAHRPNEHISVEEFLESIEHLIAFITSWCNENSDRGLNDATQEALSS